MKKIVATLALAVTLALGAIALAQQGGGIQGGVVSAGSLTGTVAVANGGTNLTTSADDNIMVGNGTTWQSKAVPNCTDTGGNHLNYDTSTNTVSCGTSGGGATATNVVKPSNTSRASNATASADPDLSTTLGTAGTYSIKGYVSFTAGGTGGLKANLFASQAVANSRFGMWRSQAGSTATNAIFPGSAPTTTITTATRIDDATGNAGAFWIDGQVVIPSSTTISLTWAQQTSDATATVLEQGSYITFTKVL